MNDDQWLFLGVIGFWLVVIAALKLARSRVSIVPIVPFFPAAAIGVGLLLNLAIAWLGTGIIGAAHALMVIAATLSIGPWSKPKVDVHERTRTADQESAPREDVQKGDAPMRADS
jgi:hypothetical protein